MTLALARLAADAVLYEGYLLYPYRSSTACCGWGATTTR